MDNFDELLMEMPFSGVLGAGDEPVVLRDDVVQKLMLRVRHDLAYAEGERSRIAKQLKIDRMTVDLDPKQPAYPGGPDVTMPLTRSKFDGVRAHLRDAIEQRPFFSVTPETEDANLVAPIYNAVMERELNLSSSREKLVQTIDEAAAVGTGVVGYAFTRKGNEDFLQIFVTRMENFYCYPTALDDFTHASTFRFFREPYWLMLENAREGVYDERAVNMLREHGSSEKLTKEEETNKEGSGLFTPENRTHALWECYTRFDAGDDAGELAGLRLWRIVFSKYIPIPILVEPNPFGDAFDAPPYDPVRVMKRPGYVWGMSFPRQLRAIQKIADNAANTRIAYNNLASAPIIQVDRNNPFKHALKKGLVPGGLVETLGPPDKNGIVPLQLPHPNLTIEDMQWASNLGDEATFSNYQMSGQPLSSGRRTKFEVQTGFNVGTLKLRLNLSDYAYDLARIAKKMWAIIDAYKIAPAGVFEVYREGKRYVIASQSVSQGELMQIVMEALNSRGVTNQDIVDHVQEFQVQSAEQLPGSVASYYLVNGSIPSSRRSDITWSLTGTKIIADKIGEVQQLQEFAPYLQLLPMAREDTRIYHFLKSLLISMGRTDWRLLLEDDPKVFMGNEAFQQSIQPFAETEQRSSRM